MGLIFKPFDSTRLGVAYRSTINHNLKGNASFSNVTAALAPSFPTTGATARLVTPDSVSTSIVQQLDAQWELLGDVTWTGWSVFKQLSVLSTSGTVLSNQPENWTNTMRYSIGGSYRVNQQLKLRIGYAYDQSPVSTLYRTARIPDNDRNWLSCGLGYKLTAHSSLDAGYTHIFIANTPVNQGAIGTLTGQLLGNYTSSIDVISVQFTHTFE